MNSKCKMACGNTMSLFALRKKSGMAAYEANPSTVHTLRI